MVNAHGLLPYRQVQLANLGVLPEQLDSGVGHNHTERPGLGLGHGCAGGAHASFVGNVHLKGVCPR